MLHHHAVGPHVAEILPAPALAKSAWTRLGSPPPPRVGQWRSISWPIPGLSCQKWSIWVTRCCITTQLGHTLQRSLPPPTQRNCLDALPCCCGCCWSAAAHSHGLDARPGQQGGGGGLAARGCVCMRGVTNLVAEAAEASLAGPPMLERCAFTVSCRKCRKKCKGEGSGAAPSTLFLPRRGCSGPVSWGVTGWCELTPSMPWPVVGRMPSQSRSRSSALTGMHGPSQEILPIFALVWRRFGSLNSLRCWCALIELCWLRGLDLGVGLGNLGTVFGFLGHWIPEVRK